MCNCKLPQSVYFIVKGICGDYERRRKGIASGRISASAVEECERLNAIVDCAVDGIGSGLRAIIDDVALGRGYDFSPLSAYMAKNTYYKYKKTFVCSLAEGLRLV